MSRIVQRIVAWSVLCGALLAGASVPALATGEEAWRRPLSEPERRAVELALGYLHGGPEAWWPELASGSPLRDLGEASALDEIAVRVGPPEGARWLLQTPASGGPEGLAVFSVVFPSGVEETLTLLLAQEEGAWRIQALRSLADPGSPDGAFWHRSSPPVPGPAASGPRTTDSGVDRRLVAALLALLGAAAAALALAALPAGRRPARRLTAAALVAAVAGAAGGLAACRQDAPSSPRVSPSVAALPQDEALFQSLGALRELRWAMAIGTSARTIEELFGRLPRAEDLSAIAALWRAETLLSQVDLSAAEALLREVPDPSPIPLGELVRARLAAARGEAEEAVERYENVVRIGTDHDGLRLETAQGLAGLGRTIESEVLFTQAAEMGSRLAEVHYAMARLAVLSQRLEAGEEHLSLAWRLEPVLREALFGDPLLSTLCARPSLFGTFSFSSPEEPEVIPAHRGRRALTLPPGATADLNGELLRLAVGEAELYVPAGAELAPPEAAVETALDRRRRLEDRVLARLPELQDEARTQAVLARPQRRRELLDAAATLARHNRWEELIRLTDGIAEGVEKAPLVLGQLRAAALRRRGREGDAQALLVRLAKTSLESRRRDPGALRQLAELFVAGRDYDVAIRLIRRAGQLSPMASGDRRIRQIRLEQELYEDPRYRRSEHFEIVYPRYTGDRYAESLGAVLEAELLRIGRWIPIVDGYAHTVNLYPLQQFLEAYSGGVLVLGIYDGRLRVPLADLPSLHPQLVSVLSHELAHGMIARATDDQAPKWFHEGLAQHVEMVPGRINPIPDLAREGRVLSFSMIEAILDGFSEPQLVDLAYAEAAWVVHYIEAVHGLRAIRALIGAFARGSTTEEAVEEVLGMSVAELDRAVWRWCVHEAPASWPTELRRYDRDFDPLVRRSADVGSVPGDEGAGTGEAVATLRSWHRRYADRTREVRRTLGRLVAPIRSGDRLPRSSCAAFDRQLDGVLGDPEVLAAPEPRVRQHLRVAYESLRAMAAACRRGDAAGSRHTLELAEGAFGRAAGELARHGLTP